jgi:hypothetical protein
MQFEREEWKHYPLERLFDCLKLGPDAGGSAGNIYHKALAELECRKYDAQEAVREAQVDAAKEAKKTAEYTREAAQAAKETAEYTKRNARYMLWSVVAILFTSFISAAVNIAIWLFPRAH